jgi:hypothetical protein
MNGKFPDWNEWRGLTNEQREYELYRVLSFLSGEATMAKSEYSQIKKDCMLQVGTCAGKFQELDDNIKAKKFWDRTAAAIGGAVGGAITALGIKIGG